MAVVAGFLFPLPMLGLLVICLVASCTDGPQRIREWYPLNKADVVADVLYLQETWYLITLLLLLANGPDRYSLDNAIGLNILQLVGVL